MAINSQKLLPQAKLASTKVNVEKKNVLLKKELINIRKTLISIDKLLLTNSLFQRKATELKRKDTERQKFKEKETKLERKKEKEITKDDKSSIPQLGIFDRINRFITFTFLGFLFNKFSKYLPQILEFSKKIQPIAQFIESFIGNVFNGIVNFIDFGYKSHEKISNFAKQLGGENFQKTFDDFSGNLTKFINLAIVVGMATMGGTDFGLGKKVTPQGTVSSAQASAKYGYRPEPLPEGVKRGSTEGRSISRSQTRAQREASKASRKVTGAQIRQGISKTSAQQIAKKGVGRFAGKVFGRIPIIGGLVDFLFALWSGEPVGRAAAKGVGATIGSALGTFIPIPFAGTILGGILGDIVGGALYDTIVGSRPERKKVQGRSRGGPITRGRRKVRGVVKRTVRVTKTPPKVPPAKPGESIGGKKNLQRIFPEPTGQQKGKTVNPYGFLTDTANSFLKTDIAGALGAVFIKPFLGQLPTKEDYKNFGLAMNIWISNATSKGLIGGNATGGFADGGIINNGMMGDISKWAEKSIEEMIKNKVTDAINDLRKNLGLESLSGPVSPGDMNDAVLSESEMDLFQRLILAESGGQGKIGMSLVARSVLNRAGLIQSGKATTGTFSANDSTVTGVIMGRNQYQPIRNGRINDQRTQQQMDAAKEAIQFAQDPGKLRAALKSDGLDDGTINKLLAATGFRAGSAFNDPSQNVNVVKYKGHYFNTAGNTALIIASSQISTEITSPLGRRSSGYAPSKPGLFNAIEYITGDRTHSNYELNGHGRPDNYHDHIAFRTIADKERAKAALRAAGIQLGSELRSGDRGYHGANLAIDIPGGQWGGGPRDPITKSHFEGSKKVREVLGFKDGGEVGFDKKSKNIRPLQNFPYYDQGCTTFAILPFETTKLVPIQSSSQNKIAFTVGGGGGGVNSTNNRSRMFV